LKEIREAVGLTQAELGKLLSVADVTVSRYEKGTRQIGADELPRIADALGVSACDFFEEQPVTVEPAVERAAQRAAEIAVARAWEQIREEMRAALAEHERTVHAGPPQPEKLKITPQPVEPAQATPKQRIVQRLSRAWETLPEEEQEYVWRMVEERKRLREREIPAEVEQPEADTAD
jgi:transcriptional regulator with XRE-family HTH domain